MKRGLVIGKFMPVHNGHRALIRFATQYCDELIVSMSYKDDDAIPGLLRFSWIQEIFRDDPHIKPEVVQDNFDDESLPIQERTKSWANFLNNRYGKIDVLISSEEYGPWLAKYLNAEHFFFDIHRKLIPVSATQIRHNPYHYWDFIPEAVRPYFVKKVCFYGAESTGKSVMARHLAEVYKTEFVPEVAREIVSSNDFTIEDIITIGHAQTERVLEKVKTANKILFCDTDLITTQIYCKHYLGIVPSVLYELEKRVFYDQYFLFDIDVPWVADGMRDLGNERKKMFDTFKQQLEVRNIPYLLVKGDYNERERFLRMELDKMISH